MTMRVVLAVMLPGLCALAGPDRPESYILRVASAVEQAGEYSASVNGAMTQSAHDAAKRLIVGGKLWAGGNPAFVSELCGRAGGVMFIQSLGDNTPGAGDVVLYGLPGGPPIPETAIQSGALVVAFGDGSIDGVPNVFSGYAADYAISPTLASIVPAWIYTGNLIEACAQRGKMPVTYETIGLPGGHPRIQQYQAKGVFWIDYDASEWDVKGPLQLGAKYARSVAGILRRVEEEDREKLNRAGEWAARSLADNKTVYMYCMGHFVPDEAAKSEIGSRFKIAAWNSGFTTLKPPDDEFSPGDLAIHIGYQHPPYGLYERARPDGAKIVYVDVLEHRDWKSDPNAIWIDPMWPWDDAVVTLPNYDIPMLPPSGIVNSAIAWEIYRLAAQ